MSYSPLGRALTPSFALLMLAACGPDQNDSAGPNLADQPGSGATAAAQTASHHLTIGAFEGSYDPLTDVFAIEPLPLEALDADLGDEVFRMRTQGLGYCNDFTIGASGVQLDTVADLWGSDPTDDPLIPQVAFTLEQCIRDGADEPNLDALTTWGSLFYDEGGALCARVRARNNLAVDLDNVIAEMVFVRAGYEAYQAREVPAGHPACCGTGADLDALPGGQNAPSTLGGGVFSFGNIDAGESADVQWTFRNDGQNRLAFRGRLVAQVAEVDNGEDDDCDGRVDNALGEYADGAACREGADCSSGLCEDIDAGTGEGTCGVQCEEGYYGPTCTICPGGGTCNGHGECDDGPGGSGACSCSTGYAGADCSDCAGGYYTAAGGACAACPECQNGGLCVEAGAEAGSCSCPGGWTGATCETAVSTGTWTRNSPIERTCPAGTYARSTTMLYSTGPYPPAFESGVFVPASWVSGARLICSDGSTHNIGSGSVLGSATCSSGANGLGYNQHESWGDFAPIPLGLSYRCVGEPWHNDWEPCYYGGIQPACETAPSVRVECPAGQRATGLRANADGTHPGLRCTPF